MSLTGITLGSGITIGAGIGINTGIVTTNLALALDASTYSGSGTTWPATVGPDATLYNGVTWTGTSPGYFTFVPSSLQFATAPNIGDLSNWTVECWFKVTSSFAGYEYPALVTTVYQEQDGTLYSNINYTLSTYPDSATLTTGYFNGAWHNTSGFTPTVGEWYQMVGTFDGTTMTTYVNGVEFSSAAGVGGSIANGGPIRIARRWDGDGEAKYFMPAEISIVRIYSAALTAAQVRQNFNVDRLRFGIVPDLVTSGLISNLDAGNASSYPGTGTTWYDLSTAANNASLQGTAPWTSAGSQSYFTFTSGYANAGYILPNTTYTKIGIFRYAGGYFGNLSSGGSADLHAFWGADTQYLQSGHNGAWYTVVSPISTPANQWVFGAVSFSNTTGWRLYLNNHSVVTNPSTDQFTANPALLNVGAFDTANNLGGDVAVSLVYNRVLTDAEIAQNFAHYQARFGF